MRISDWSSDVCSSDLTEHSAFDLAVPAQGLLTLVRVIDDRVRVVDRAHRLQRVDGLPGNIAKFGDPPTDVCAVGIELLPLRDRVRAEELRLGKVCVSAFRIRCPPYHSKKKKLH